MTKKDRQIVFDKYNGKCAYCGESGHTLQIEHLLMFNRTEYGLHHPGNVVPCCKSCNKRERKNDKSYTNWDEHLKIVCVRRNENNQYQMRKNKIEKSIADEKYPNLDEKFWNRKQMFTVPIGEWIKNPLKEYFSKILFQSGNFVENFCDKKIINQIFKDHCSDKSNHTRELRLIFSSCLWWNFIKGKCQC